MSREETPHVDEESRSQRVTKKNQLLALYLAGITDVEDLATMTNVRPSYVGTVLQQAGFLHGYFDLYTSTAQPMNVYSKLFASQLGFKNVDTARHSVRSLIVYTPNLRGRRPCRTTSRAVHGARHVRSRAVDG